jgi:hypothetical protein
MPLKYKPRASTNKLGVLSGEIENEDGMSQDARDKFVI